MLILRKNHGIGIGADASAQISEINVRTPLACDPQIDRESRPAALNDGAAEAELIV